MLKIWGVKICFLHPVLGDMYMIVKVAVDTKTSTVDKIFEYIVPPNLLEKVQAGVRCSVPFGNGNKRRIGFILSVLENSEYEESKLKEICEVLDEVPLLSRQRLIEAFRIKNRYFCSFIEAIRLFLPVGAKTDIDEVYEISGESEEFDDETQRRIYEKIMLAGRLKYEFLKENFGSGVRSYLKKLESRGLIKSEFKWHDKTESKYTTVYYLENKNIDLSKIQKNAAAQRRALKVLSDVEYLSMPDLCMFAGCSSATIKALMGKGMVFSKVIEQKRLPYSHVGKCSNSDMLTPIQKSIAEKVIKGDNKKPFLLRGVTGSGKTQIYINIIESVLKEGKTALVLVPEISLTHQLVGRFIKIFGERVALLHSKLSDGERFDQWMSIADGEGSVIIGARSAVFAPSDNIGIIIVDEEHEDTYKSESGVRYDAREVAILRAKSSGAKVLFASATPTVVDYYRAKSGVYELLELSERYNGAKMPRAIIADMRQELKEGNRSPISSVLREELLKNLAADEQSILFLNRRGYSTFVSCRDCGEAIGCPSCNISLTYHSYGDYLMCHYCGHRENVPKACPHCGSVNIKGFGTGTQKVEEKIENEFPGATVLRMDVDTTSKKDAHEKILDSFRHDGIDILLGTQMVAKGLDFENVTLVGVLAADQLLNMGDYRAAEKTFDLITQVCGRSGRGEKNGRSVIQTYSPENSTIKYASKHDYTGFYEDEIKMRKILNYPPFCDIINVTVFGDNQQWVKDKISDVFKKFKDKISEYEGSCFYPPVPCVIDKIKNKYRWHFWFKCRYDERISERVRTILEKENLPQIITEINPNYI